MHILSRTRVFQSLKVANLPLSLYFIPFFYVAENERVAIFLAESTYQGLFHRLLILVAPTT
jgi:hypothetical protein